MAQRYFEFAAATVMASVAATVLATAQTQPAPAARPEDGRAVTAVGCLKQERDIHGRMTTDEGAKPGDAFMLMNARITSASVPEAPITSDPATASTGAAARERDRTTSPSGAPGAGGAGTSGTGSTSVQTTEHRPDETARGGATGNPAAMCGPDTMYKVVGLPDGELAPLLGKEVEIQATLDANTMGSAALRQPAATMGREPASTPSASTPPPEPTQAPATQSDRQGTRPPTASLPELRATAIRATGGRCQGT
jgi:hypothetical protein